MKDRNGVEITVGAAAVVHRMVMGQVGRTGVVSMLWPGFPDSLSVLVDDPEWPRGWWAWCRSSDVAVVASGERGSRA